MKDDFKDFRGRESHVIPEIKQWWRGSEEKI
jgi:hypothetical protein